jgi:hypothetical protein
MPFAQRNRILRMTKLLALGALFSIFTTGNTETLIAQEAIAEARPVGQASEVPNADTPAKPKLRPLTVATELSGGTRITGTLVEATALQMKTAFGEAQIPLSEIAGIRFASGDSNSTTVVMLNGDSITGATDLKFLTIETEWGTAKINGQSLLSMLFVPGLQWESTGGLSGKRWTLTEIAAKPNALNPNPNRVNGPVSGIPSSTTGNPQTIRNPFNQPSSGTSSSGIIVNPGPQ